MDIKLALRHVAESTRPDHWKVEYLMELCTKSLEEIKRLEKIEKQLPEQMRDCTITLHECELGHTWLSASNWLDHGCVWCRMMKIREIASNR